jgi:hypothetical protein
MAVAGSVALGGADTLDELARSIVEHGAAVRLEALVGVPAKPAQLAFAPTGLAITRGKRVDAYRWSEVRWTKLRRGAAAVRTEAPRERVVKKKDTTEIRPYIEKKTRGIRVLVDGIVEPHLARPLTNVLEDMRTGKFSYQGTSWIAYQNSVDSLHHAFDEQNDPAIPAAAAGLWLAVGFLISLIVPVGVNAANLRAVPAGSFAIWDPLGILDPRGIIAGFAASAMITAIVLRLGLGTAATIWARGASRGWARRGGNPLVRIAIRQLARMVMAPASAAVIVLLALLAFWPNVAATVLVSASGARNEVLLPFISLDQPWRAAIDITREGNGTTIRFADGRVATTVGHELGGGTQQQFFDKTTAWRAAAR